jgi:uncharacterized protein
MSARPRLPHPIWLVLLLPCYVAWRLLPSLSGKMGMAIAAVALLAACAILPRLMGLGPHNRKWADGVAWVGFTAMGFFSFLFVATLLRDAVLLLAHFIVSDERAAALAILTARGALILTFVLTLFGLLIARHPRLVDVNIPVANLPRALQGFSIAQISDLHVGRTIQRGFVERIVARVNQLNADVIAITGDLVDGSVKDLAPHTAPLSQLSARHGVYFVTGNHEYYSGEPAWTAELRRLGLRVLKNQHVTIQHAGASLVLAGVTDFSAHHFDPAQRSDPAAALHGAPQNSGAKILLAHQPSTASAAAHAGFDVQISGHTHGGQFWPWNLLVGYFQPFTAGLNRLRNLSIYVSRGTGYWGPPNRFWVPAEITRIRLVAA